ncbi:3-hydroxyisobutyrate dehydrogenase [Chromobacterium phragmitis]|uniref:3-hydroxyisobutyrate dehydrogenase n=1 Tax=Chromobacterium phragmitis TaxID=2202141 RepID=A0A344UCF1_9NEIS|nr:3-hydroxyisobutyrate dehydrogenase [Chromobacterium phragmitis]AXE31541.1 3-hydroxyisobutyrate dehydrogenase [Chromobacterium phragmitis]AXE32949.1 3-hydroxyisobutyrate dehydrogenase [Chromobacterium phragmitis]
MENIAFIGLGNMGGPMAVNLLNKGFQVSAFDLSADALAKLASAGGRAATNAADAVKEASVVISMLPAGKHVAGLYLGDEGLFAKLARGALVIDCSTIDAGTARKVAEAAQMQGIAMLDAPVSGGTAGAAAGTLTFIVGGAAQDLARARPMLEAMGKNIFHAGGPGAGQTAKICNNMLLGILMAGTAEALALGVKNGLDPKVLSEIISKSSGRNWATELYNPWPGVMENAPASRGYAGGFMSELMLKDLGLAEETAMQSHAANPLGALARNLYEEHVQQGNGKLDFSSIVRHFHHLD